MTAWQLLIPLISAFIGWFTNWIAIKMLFHPKEPKKLLGITFHGIFPKRQKQFALNLGKLVSSELLSFNEIEQKITSTDNLNKLMPFIESKIDVFLRVKLGEAFPMIAMFIGENTIQQLKGIFLKELNEIFPELITHHMKQLESQLDLENIVAEKVSGFSSDKLESILNEIMSREFRFVEIIGGILGFVIGLVQVFITIATS